MQSIFIFLTLVSTAIVFGIALSATLVVHPILVNISRKAAIEIFKPFFDKTHVIVLAVSIAATVFALITSVVTKNWWWFVISLIMHLNGPYTIFGMMPLNRRLMAEDVDPESADTASDLVNWGKLHAVRTGLNAITFFLLLILALQG